MDTVACYCSNLRRAALALTSLYDAALAPHGIRVTQYSLLCAVKRHGEANLTELSQATGLDRSTLGRNLRVLETQGLVSLSPGDDQRDRVVALTELGGARIRGAARDWGRVQDSLSRALGAEGDRLLATARRVTEVALGASRRQTEAP